MALSALQPSWVTWRKAAWKSCPVNTAKAVPGTLWAAGKMKPSLYLKIKAAKEQGWGTRVTQAAAAWPSLLVCLGQCLENAPKSTLSLTLGCSSSMPKAAAFCRALRVVLTLLLSLWPPAQPLCPRPLWPKNGVRPCCPATGANGRQPAQTPPNPFWERRRGTVAGATLGFSILIHLWGGGAGAGHLLQQDANQGVGDPRKWGAEGVQSCSRGADLQLRGAWLACMWNGAQIISDHPPARSRGSPSGPQMMINDTRQHPVTSYTS